MRRLLVLVVLVAGVLVSAGAPAAGQPPAETTLTGVRSVATGHQHSCAVLTNGEVRCWGAGDYGRLGNGVAGNPASATPSTVIAVSGSGPLTGVTQVALGNDHTCALLASGQVRCWGFNDRGQLGNNAGYASFNRPQVVLNGAGTGPLQGVIAIDVGGDTSCAVLASHQLRCWGYNDDGEVGDGSRSDRQLPRPVESPSGTGRLTGVTQVSVGNRTTCARLSSGQARCWGRGYAGEVGDGTRTARRLRPRVVLAVSGPGPLTGVAQVSAGDSVTCARLANRQVRCWGRGSEGGLGTGSAVRHTRPTPVKQVDGTGNLGGVTRVEAGWSGACARLANGQARCWGVGDYGQRGDGTTTLVGLLPVVVLDEAGTAPLTGVVQLHHGLRHTCVRAGDGARCWGYGLSGNLGDGNQEDSPLPVTVIA